MRAESVGGRNSHGLSLIQWCAALGFLLGILMPFLSSRVRTRLAARPEEMLLSYELESGTNVLEAVLGPRRYVCWTSATSAGSLAEVRAQPTAVFPSTIEVHYGSGPEESPSPSSMVPFRITKKGFSRVRIVVVTKERCWLHGAADE